MLLPLMLIEWRREAQSPQGVRGSFSSLPSWFLGHSGLDVSSPCSQIVRVHSSFHPSPPPSFLFFEDGGSATGHSVFGGRSRVLASVWVSTSFFYWVISFSLRGFLSMGLNLATALEPMSAALHQVHLHNPENEYFLKFCPQGTLGPPSP